MAQSSGLYWPELNSEYTEGHSFEPTNEVMDNDTDLWQSFGEAHNPLIVVAGKGQNYVEQLITRSKGDSIVDYRHGDNAILSGITTALKEAGVNEVCYAYDAISDHNSFQNISKILAKTGSKMTVVVPWEDYSDIPSYIEQSITMVTDIFQDTSSIEDTARTRASGKDFGFVFSRFFSRGL
ncbi:hypothetical protein F5884DRAFT_864089 [Xylogone sp. PMI_703]|nr:hypothetical protein F5884DRAFT_864089 [Xylogone sp. PMI_703]